MRQVERTAEGTSSSSGWDTHDPLGISDDLSSCGRGQAIADEPRGGDGRIEPQFEIRVATDINWTT